MAHVLLKKTRIAEFNTGHEHTVLDLVMRSYLGPTGVVYVKVAVVISQLDAAKRNLHQRDKGHLVTSFPLHSKSGHPQRPF